MILYIVKEGDIVGTSTRRTNKAINNILKTHKISQNGDGIDKIISEALFPQKGNSRIKSSIINSTCSKSFIQTIKAVITISQKIHQDSNFCFNIPNYNELSPIEKVEYIAENICFDEDPLLKQTIMNILYSKDSPIEYFKDAYVVIKDILSEYYTEQFEKIMFEELASSTSDMDDEKCKQKIKLLVEKEIDNNFSYKDYQLIIEKKEEESFLSKKIRSIGSLVLRGLKI